MENRLIYLGYRVKIPLSIRPCRFKSGPMHQCLKGVIPILITPFKFLSVFEGFDFLQRMQKQLQANRKGGKLRLVATGSSNPNIVLMI